MSDAVDNSTISYAHAPQAHRYEVRDGDEVIGFAEYRVPDEKHLDFVHTEVDESYGGRGLAGELVRFALDDVRQQGKRAIPHCSYVAKWIGKHDEYADLADFPA
ncbi:N-acetyltransferase [Nocardioides sp. zg-536]|uniref:N-acetyltransferase n=1 Tax=Nocardioides faecalis TaxID=2803858 RepID=A0A939BYH0_9ACTN|nr:GNAT family N-acetyltransferase [Nocardioides faecalis]MBM9460333.1 N-acetyltransferase [Nocardioides faecalis]MBS4751258.1 N-acetyltransferase [Nocardioides faecalis]QVI59839.1 N-acetyltransferase [Nocardioides faecalis]